MTDPLSDVSTLFQRVRFGLDLWIQARLMPFRIRHRDLAGALQLAHPRAPGRSARMTAADIARSVRRTTRRPWLMRNNRCLRQGLLSFRFLSEAGFEPELHFGVDPESMKSPDLAAHCWIVIDGQPVINEPQRGMVTVLVHPRADKSRLAAT